MYFIQAENGPVKIGVARDPAGRLRDLQVGNPYRLTLLAVLPGAFREEYKLHTLFAEAKMVGEWFEPIDDLLEFIRSGGKWTVALENRWEREKCKTLGVEYEPPGQIKSYPKIPLCRQCGVNLRATEPGVDEDDVILSELHFPEMCGACREFADLRASDADPFADHEAA